MIPLLVPALLLAGCSTEPGPIREKPLRVGPLQGGQSADSDLDSGFFDTAGSPVDSGFGDTGSGGGQGDSPGDPGPPGSGIAQTCNEWSFSGGTSGWSMNSHIELAAGQSSGSTRFNTAEDASLMFSAPLDPSRCSLVDVTLKVTGGPSVGQLFWKRNQDGEYAESRSRKFRLFEDEQWHRYVFNLAGHGEWNGTIRDLRFDPRAGFGTVEVQSIKIHAPEAVYPPALSMGQAVWLHTDVSSWTATSNLSSVSVSSDQICLHHDKASTWDIRVIGGDVEVAANPWVFVWVPDLGHLGGTWYAATWEWMRPGQTCKNRLSVAGDHIKQSPFHPTSGWRPSTGEELYFMVSGLARGSERNNSERSNVMRVVWP